jgi:hypothetical protein
MKTQRLVVTSMTVSFGAKGVVMRLRTALFARHILTIPLLLPLVSCTQDAPAPKISSRSFANGVPQNGFPSWTESVIYVLTNRARVDPATELAETCRSCDSVSYAVARPLAYSVKGSRAARFHAASLLKAGSGLMHDSVCKIVSNIDEIYPDQCDGDPSCACEGGVANCTCSGGKPYCTCAGGSCTSTWGRIGMFGYGGGGENAAAGNSDPKRTFSQWINSSGHRNNLMKSSHRSIGVGHYGGSGGCWRDFSVQVFGSGSLATKIPGGIHYPRSGSTSTSFTFYANYYDSGNAPTLTTVNIGGQCSNLTLERGAADQGSYSVESKLASGCQRYYFVFRDSAGKLQTYPETGSYGIAVGGGTCAFYDAAARPPLGQGCGVCSVDADCDDGNPCTQDKCNVDTCETTPVAGCCTVNAQCDDGDVCTKDSCDQATNKCTASAIAGCCKKDGECDDGDVCTTDSCDPKTHRCKAAPIAGCCKKDGECDDGDVCTKDSCDPGTNRCTASPISGCCKTDSQCDDGGRCTEDSCDKTTNRCVFAPLDGCCTKAEDCADSDPCTQDSCDTQSGRCENSPVDACCRDDTACDDSDSCTIDRCDPTTHRCVHDPHPSCGRADAGSTTADSGSTSTTDAGIDEEGRREIGKTLSGSCAVVVDAHAPTSSWPL